jgi:hypothetical protein
VAASSKRAPQAGCDAGWARVVARAVTRPVYPPARGFTSRLSSPALVGMRDAFGATSELLPGTPNPLGGA